MAIAKLKSQKSFSLVYVLSLRDGYPNTAVISDAVVYRKESP